VFAGSTVEADPGAFEREANGRRAVLGRLMVSVLGIGRLLRWRTIEPQRLRDLTPGECLRRRRVALEGEGEE
jgi:hypothetical protein